MRTIDLSEETRTIAELLDWANQEPVLIHSKQGKDYVLEEADDFDQEAAMLGNSEKFMSFLHERTQTGKEIPAADVAQRLGIARKD
ncbi:MAG: hypothetical protein NTX50_24645 [Candidatus Sumerlaeota bacterium]|nr:hypothetical protein [Candidatus Sumerlaeota bacterium]